MTLSRDGGTFMRALVSVSSHGDTHIRYVTIFGGAIAFKPPRRSTVHFLLPALLAPPTHIYETHPSIRRRWRIRLIVHSVRPAIIKSPFPKVWLTMGKLRLLTLVWWWNTATMPPLLLLLLRSTTSTKPLVLVSLLRGPLLVLRFRRKTKSIFFHLFSPPYTAAPAPGIRR